MSVTGDAMVDRAKTYQQACTDEPGRSWGLERVREGPAGPDVYRIVGVESGRCLTFSEERFGGAQVIVQQTCDPASDAQQWRFVVEEQRNRFSYGVFINMGRSGCLDVNGGSVDVGTPVVLWFCGEQLNQRFGVANEVVSPPP
ncbi:MAG: ricin-type beta-trefoil lectin domain protein [Actinomycetota bacterium]|nr:ricin-type beta-trefoil lectin domain protein [Actinomycetota bacterium]